MDVTVVDAELPLRPAGSHPMRRHFSANDFFTVGSDSESSTKTSRSVEVDQESASGASTQEGDADDERYIHFQSSPRIARWKRQEDASSDHPKSSPLPSPRLKGPEATEEEEQETETLDQRAHRLAAFAKLVKHSEFFDRDDYDLVVDAAKKAAKERDDYVARLSKKEQLMRILQERERFIEDAVRERRLLPSQDHLLFTSLVRKQVMLMQMLSGASP
jgi:hypothetical protein